MNTNTSTTSNNNLFASIDIGTNSIKLLIVQASPSSGHFLPLHRLTDPVCLGRDSSSSSTISTHSINLSISSLQKFHKIITTHNIPPSQIRCVATSAVREAQNRSGFLTAVKKDAGFDVSVLSGEQEAKFIYFGVIQFLPVFSKRVLAVDIGGGSTEFVIGYKGDVVLCVSLKLGHVGLTQKFGENFVEMRKFVNSVIRESGLIENVKNCGFEVVVGCSGTVKAVEKAVFLGYSRDFRECDNNYNCNCNDDCYCNDCGRDWRFSKGELRSVVERLCSEGPGEKVRRDGFFKRRSEFIVAGAVLLDEIFEVLGIEEMEVSGYALREGVIAESLAEVFTGYDLSANARWGSVVRLARRFSEKKRFKAAVKCASIAKEIFNHLRNWSEGADNEVKLGVYLDEKDLECLEAACLLHNIGLFTGKKGYHKQSYHIIMNGDHLHGYSTVEVKLIALLTRHHRKKFPKSDCASLKEMLEELKQKFIILCAIIRVSVILQQKDGLNFQDMEFSQSDAGFKLVFGEARDQQALHMADDIGEELRKELEHLKRVISAAIIS